MTARGVFIVGLNGSGKTTLGRALSRRLGWFRMDVEDYYFPDMSVPFAKSRSKEEVCRLMLADICDRGDFVLSSVSANLSEEILAYCALAVWLRAPREVRLARIEAREIARFGSRVLPGGDLYAQHRRFREFAAGREEAVVEDGLRTLDCPVLALDAALPVDQNVERIAMCCVEMGLL